MKKTKYKFGVGLRRASKYADQDYVASLSEEDKNWLAVFVGEYYANRFDKENPIHNTSELRRKVYKMHNSIFADLMLATVDEILKNIQKKGAIIDNKKKSNNGKFYKERMSADARERKNLHQQEYYRKNRAKIKFKNNEYYKRKKLKLKNSAD
jgi:uncharacterized membrane protein